MSLMFWLDCIHVAGRLLSYKQAIDITLLVSHAWPQLFDDFEVCMMCSSLRISDSLKHLPLSAEGIVGKMMSDEKLLH